MRVHQDGAGVRTDHVAQHTLRQRQVLVQQGGGRLRARQRLHAGPQLAQIGHVRVQFVVVGAFGLGADDEAAFLPFGHQRLQAFAQLRALGLGIDLLGNADMRIMRQIDQHAAGHADLRGQPSALGAQGILDHLDHDGLPFEQQFSIGVGGSWLRSPGSPQVRDMDECRAFQPDVDECALHARQHADHTAQVNIAYMAALDAALDMQFLHRSLLDQRDAGLERGDIDQDVFAHCGGSGHGAVVSIELGGRLTRRIVNVPPGQASRDGAFSLTKLGAGGTEWWLGAGVRILFCTEGRVGGERERGEGRGETGRPDSRSSEKGRRKRDVGKGTSTGVGG